jgi:non-specific serine/threonine protein kinase
MMQLLQPIPLVPTARKRAEAPAPSSPSWRPGAPESVLAFGRFRLLPRRRQLLADGVPVELGARAFDVLTVLAESRGLLVSKDELLNRAWPGTIVEENNIHVQVSAVRKALGRDRDFIVTISGRGYRFTAEVRSEVGDPISLMRPAPTAAELGRRGNLPAGVADFVGRDVELQHLVDLVAAHRLVTVTGPTGVGKTRLALESARHLVPDMADGVWHADLASLTDPGSVQEAVVRSLGLESSRSMPPHWLAAALRPKRMLLVLDNCEHLVDAAARTAEWLLRTGPDIRILVTSQEPLLAEGEHIVRLAPLDLPSDPSDRADDALRHGSVRLFLSRAQSADPDFILDCGTMPLAVSICRRLDGLPLAIELAAARAATLGLEAVASGIDEPFEILTEGHRTDLPRHRTLEAALDWSYSLLSQADRRVASRLAELSGCFSLEEALCAAGAGSRQAALDGISRLVMKSLLSVDKRGVAPRYRFLGTTRTYLSRRPADGQPVSTGFWADPASGAPFDRSFQNRSGVPKDA